MKIGIIVHSHTGNTYSVAQRLKDTLSAAGHSVNIEQITPAGGEQKPGRDAGKIQLETKPDADTYEALIFGAPVHGGSVSPAMTAYLMQIPSLQGKKVACLVTQFFPYPWMGGNRAISQMRRLCESKNAVVCGTGVVNWTGAQREKRIAEVVERLSKLF